MQEKTELHVIFSHINNSTEANLYIIYILRLFLIETVFLYNKRMIALPH